MVKHTLKILLRENLKSIEGSLKAHFEEQQQMKAFIKSFVLLQRNQAFKKFSLAAKKEENSANLCSQSLYLALFNSFTISRRFQYSKVNIINTNKY